MDESSSSTLLNDLLYALKNNNIGKFQELLESGTDIDIDFYFGDPDYGTLLDLCCQEIGLHSFVNLLLAHGANPNIVNKIRKKAPIHFAVENDDIDTLGSLLDCSKTDVNILDSTGSCALHYAVKDISLLELLLKNKNIDVNILNKKGKSPLLCALQDKNKNESCILALLEHNKLDLDGDPNSAKIKEYLNNYLPNWNFYIKPKDNVLKEISFSQAFNLLQNGKYDDFIAIIQDKKNDPKFLESNNGDHTFLQYCCIFGIPTVVKELLAVNVDPNNATTKTPSTPLMLAARKGYIDIVRMLINSGKCSFLPVKSETVLHYVVKGSSEESGLGDSDIEKDHLACLSLLLTDARLRLSNEIINQGDTIGNTALHYAAKQGDNDMVFCLLKGGASISCFNILNEPAFANINYKTLKKYLDYCVYTNNKLPREEDFEIILNYSCLRPIPSNPSHGSNIGSLHNSEYFSGNKMYNTFESKPLLYMTQNNELKYLLKHPIFTSFLYLKWQKIYKCFYVNLVFYCTFLASMSFYILKVYPELNKDDKATSLKTGIYPFIWYLLIILLMILIFREVAQFIIAPINYLVNPENWLEVGIIITSVCILFYGEDTPFKKKAPLSVVCIMLSWSELVLFIGKHPALSTYIEMLKTVSWNFLKFLAWYFPLILAFSYSFYILFGMHDCSSANKDNEECLFNRNETDTDVDFFSSPSVSVFKTVIMLTGEFDASSVPFVTHPGLSHALFIAFLFFIAIVLFNLLNGLAVSDTQAIQSDSELVGYISRVRLIAYVETLVCNPLSNNDKIFSWNFSSCWESSFLYYYKNKMTSKFINLFQDGYLSNDSEIKILPNNRNKVVIGNNCYYSRRRESDTRCYKKFGFVEMDATVLHAIKELLLEKHAEKELEEAEKLKKENEKKCFEMIKDCNENIKMMKQMVNENKAMLDKLVKIVNGGWNP